MKVIRCPHCNRLVEVMRLPDEGASSLTDADRVVMSEDEILAQKLEAFCNSMSLSKIERRSLAGDLKPYPRVAILSALDIWHARSFGAAGKGYRYFVGIVRGEHNTMLANTKRSGGLPPMKGPS